MNNYGPMLIVELINCDDPKMLQTEESLKQFLLRVVEQADMTPATEPIVFEEKARAAGRGPGLTGLIGLVESHAAIHTYPHDSQKWAVFTLMSCKEFDFDRVANFCEAWFSADEVLHQVAWIGDEFPEYKHG